MNIKDILNICDVEIDVKVTSKKQLFKFVGELMARNLKPLYHDICEQDIYDSLCMREKLGSCAVGNGVAVPHGKLDNIHAIYGAFIRLKQPISYDFSDGDDVDIVFALLAPNDMASEQLKYLAQIARLFSDKNYCDTIRGASEVDGVYLLLTTAHDNANAA